MYSPSITNREQEVLRLIANQHTTNEIAQLLCISRETVISHRKSLLAKMHVKNSVGLVLHAIRKGMLRVYPAHETRMLH